MKTLFDLAHTLYSCIDHIFYTSSPSVWRLKNDVVVIFLFQYHTYFSSYLRHVLTDSKSRIRCDDVSTCATLQYMQRSHALTGLVCLSVLATACTPARTPTDVNIKAARESIFWSQQLLPQSIGTTIGSRPSAILGSYISLFLSKTSGLRVTGAKDAVNVGVSLLLDNAQTTNDSFELLQSVGTVMQVNIQDMLNRSPDRRIALDAYTDTLSNLLVQSKISQQTLEQQEKNLQATMKTQERAVSNAQSLLNAALAKQDYASASARQQDVSDAQSELTKTQTQDKQLTSTIEIFKKLNSSGDQRLSAIKANREVLIAGVHVENVPGIDTIGVLNGTTKRGGGLGDAIFGPVN